jgi:flagellar hook-length control protein FliK
MNTPAISNLINLANAPASGSAAAKQSGASSDTQFKQMLSRGIEERRSQAEPSKPIAKENSPAKQATQSTQSPTKANKTSSSEESNSTSIDEEATATAAEGAATSVGQSKTAFEVDADSDDDQAALAASSDELLALVANLTQAGTLPADTPADKSVDDATQPASVNVDVDVDVDVDAAAVAAALGAKSADLTSGVGLSNADLAPAARKADATAQATLTALRNRAASEAAPSEAAPSEVPGAGTEFEASLTQAKDKNGAADARTASAQPQSSQNELAAATQFKADLHAKAAVETQAAAALVPSINVAPQPQVALQQVQAAAVAATDKLAPRVGSNGWDQALGQKVVWMVAGEQQSATLTLNPPDLGPLRVVLSVSNNQATVDFAAVQPEVRQALQDAVPKLREMLGDAGIQLGQANVSAGTPNNQQGGFGERQQSSRGSGQTNDEDTDAPVRTVRSQTITGGGQGLVDTFA